MPEGSTSLWDVSPGDPGFFSVPLLSPICVSVKLFWVFIYPLRREAFLYSFQGENDGKFCCGTSVDGPDDLSGPEVELPGRPPVGLPSAPDG